MRNGQPVEINQINAAHYCEVRHTSSSRNTVAPFLNAYVPILHNTTHNTRTANR